MVILVAALVTLHLPFARVRVFDFAAREVATRYNLDLRAARLDYNLYTRRVTLTDVRLSARDHEQEPFFTARHVEVVLPWTVFRGVFAFNQIDVQAAAVSMVRHEDGTSNLPPAAGSPRDPSLPPLRLDVRGLAIDGLDFAYLDRVRGISIGAGDIHADLDWASIRVFEGVSGPLEIRNGVRLAFGEREIAAAPVAGAMAFDGSSVNLQSVRLRTAEGDLVVKGRVERVLDRPALDLSFDGSADVARAAAWGTLPIRVGGITQVTGTISGAAAGPTIAIETQSDALTIGQVSDVAASAQVTVTSDSVVVDKAVLRTGGGAIDAAATIPFGDGRPLRATAAWRNLDARTALRLLEQPDRPIAALLAGTLQYERTDDGPMTLRVANGARPGSASGAVPLAGELSLAIAHAGWQLRQQHAVPEALSVKGDLSGRVEGTAFSRATIDGKLDAGVDDVTRAAQAIERLGLDLPAIATGIKGPARAAVTLGGRLDAIEARAIVDSPALVLPGLAPALVHAEVETDPKSVRVPSVTGRIGTATLAGHARIDLQSRQLSGASEIDAPDTSAILTELPDLARVEGPLRATVVLGGTTSEPEARAQLSGQELRVSGQAIDLLTAQARITSDQIQVFSLDARQGEGMLTGVGTYVWGTRAYAANLRALNLSWTGPLVGSTDSTVRVADLRYQGSGTIERPGGEATLAFAIAGGIAGTLVGEGTATARFAGDTALVTARIPALGAFVDAKIIPRAPFTYDALAVLNKVDLASLARLAGAPQGSVTGSVSLSATASGALSDAVKSRVFVNLQDVMARVNDVPVALAAPSRLGWRDSTLSVESLDLTIGQGRLEASGELARAGARRWDAAFNGELGDLVRMGHAFGAPADLTASGRLIARWQSTAGFDASTVTLQLSAGTVTWGTLPPVSALAVQASFDGQTITVPTLTGTWQDGAVQGSATIPRALVDGSASTNSGASERAHAELRVTKLGAAAFEPWLGKETVARIQGQLSASIVAELVGVGLGDATGTLTLDEAAYTVAGVDVAQVRPSRLSLANGIVTLEDVAWEAGGSPLALEGTVTLVAAKRTLDLVLAGDVNLRILSAFAPTVSTDGQAHIDVGAAGALDDPDVNGKIELMDASLAIRDPRIVVGQINGPIVLTGNSIDFEGISGSANGGDLSLHGRLTVRSGSIAGGQLVAQLRRVALEFPEDLLSEASALITLTPGKNDWVLGGDVRIERGAYTEAISLAALAAARQSAPPVVGQEGPTWRERLRLNVFGVTEEGLRVDNNYGRIEADAAVRVVGTAKQPGLTGRVTLREGGEVYLAGHTFYIERGSITFTSPSRIEPEIDLQARGVVSGKDLTLRISGTPDRLKTDVSSPDPTVTPQEAREALYGGLVGDQQALTLLSGELLGVTGRALGLDALRLEQGQGLDSLDFRADPTLIATETDPSTRLTLSKRLRPEVELILSQSLSRSGALSAIISYKPRRNIEVRATSRDNIDRSIAVRHEITFGGAGTTQSRTVPQPRISSLQVLGSPGLSPEDLRRELRLDEGDRFDFHRWQRDLDDLRGRYLREGYYEARVRATREVSPDERTMALEYRIERGPRTSLTIEGHPLHDELVRELEDAWTRINVDQFLVEEMQTRIRRHLLAENWIGSKVEAAVAVSTPDRKDVRITVDPGTQVSRRAFRYVGNTAFDEGRLNAVLESEGQALESWLDPPRAGRAIEAFYREQGHLAVRAAVGEPTVEGDSGVLTVLMEEGPRFTIASASLNGVADARRPVVEGMAAALAPGTFYDRAAVDRIAGRIERWYLRQGFNGVRVESRAEPSAATASIAMAFDVQEGAHQILRDVTTEGVTRTRAGIIRRALRLGVGQPVDLEQWAEARRRMYDTNVFRQVDIEAVPMEPTPEDQAANIQPVRAVVRVIEYPAWRLRYGVQYREERTDEEATAETTQQGFGVLGDLQNQNLFGRAVAGGVAVSYQPNRQATSLFAQNGSFFGLPVRTNAFLFGVRERDEPAELFEVVVDRVGGSVEQRWRPLRAAELSYGYRYERNHTYDPDPAPGDDFPLDLIANVGRFTSAFLVDRRNNPFDSSAGWFSSASYERAAPWLGADLPYSKVLLQQFYYRELGRIVLASAARVGVAYRVENIVDPDDRFLAGGGTTVRGYAEDALGPRDIVGRPRGGGGLLILNQEVRFPILWRVRGVGFVDAGNVWARRSEISFGDLELGYGIGLRLDTPFALLRVDYGIPGSSIPITRRTGVSSGRWYFGIGQVY